MAGVVRKGDNGSGHGTFPPRSSTSWSTNVFANGLEVVRFGDSWAVHCCGAPCHGGSTAGAGSVFVNGEVLQISGDPISCGSTCVACSPDVFAKGV